MLNVKMAYVPNSSKLWSESDWHIWYVTEWDSFESNCSETKFQTVTA